MRQVAHYSIFKALKCFALKIGSYQILSTKILHQKQGYTIYVANFHLQAKKPSSSVPPLEKMTNRNSPHNEALGILVFSRFTFILGSPNY